MEAVAALGLACNISQVIGQATSILRVIRQVYRDGSTKDTVDLRTESEQLHEVMKELREQDLRRSGIVSDSQLHLQSQLQHIALRCQAIADELLKELSSLQSSGGKLSAIHVSWKTLKKKNTLNRLKSQLQKQRQSLESTVLVALRQQIHDQGLLQKDQLEWLDQRLECGIDDLKLYHIELKRLMEDMKLASLQQMANSQIQIQDHISSHFDSLASEERSRQTHMRLLESLKFPEMNTRMNQIRDIEKGTYHWIFDIRSDDNLHPTNQRRLINWLSCGTGIFWIQGKAGSGKSTLMRYLWQHEKTMKLLQQQSFDQQCVILKYSFWLSGTSVQKSLHGLFMSLLFQLLQDRPSHGQELLIAHSNMAHKQFNGDWSNLELTVAIKTVLKKFDLKTCLFIDGLDEIGSRSDYPTFLQFAKDITTLDGVRICVSSRPETYWVDHLSKCYQVRLQDINRADIRKFVVNKLVEADYVVTHNDKEANKLVDSITEKAEGVFLWARVAMNSVLNALDGRADWSQAIAAVHELPPQILELYGAMLAKNGQNDAVSRAEAAVYFQACLKGLTSFSYMVALRAKVHGKSVTDDDFSKSDLRLSYKTLSKRIPHISAGMLEYDRTPQSRLAILQLKRRLGKEADEEIDLDDLFENIVSESYVLDTTSGYVPGVKFSHRTVLDFLLDTEAGKVLLAASPLSDDDLFLGSVDADLMHSLFCMQSFAIQRELMKMDPTWNPVLSAASNQARAQALGQIQRTMTRIATSQNRVSQFTRKVMAVDARHVPENIEFDLIARDSYWEWPKTIALDFHGLILQRRIFPDINEAPLSLLQTNDSGRLRCSQRYKEYLLLCCFTCHSVDAFKTTNKELVSTLIGQRVNPYTVFFLPWLKPASMCAVAELVHLFYLSDVPLNESSCRFWKDTLGQIEIVRRRYLLRAYITTGPELRDIPNSNYSDSDIWIELDLGLYLQDMLEQLQSSPESATRKRFSLNKAGFGTKVMVSDRALLYHGNREPIYVSVLDDKDSAAILDLIDSGIEQDILDHTSNTGWRPKRAHWEYFNNYVRRLHQSPSIPKVKRTAFLREKGFLPDPADPRVIKGAIPRLEVVGPSLDEREQERITVDAVEVENRAHDDEDVRSNTPGSIFFDAEE